MKKHLQIATVVLLAIIGMASHAFAQQPVFRLSAEAQWSPANPSSFSTSAPDGPAGTGGEVTYQKVLFTPYPVLYITFSGTGTTHDGAALRMACTIDGVPCQAGGGPLDAASGWITLQKMPAPGAIYGGGTTNCVAPFGGIQGDGFGGPGNCHHNNINYIWCAKVTSGVHTVQLKLASDNGGEVFYGRSHVLIDGTKQQTAALCGNAAEGPFEDLSPPLEILVE